MTQLTLLEAHWSEIQNLVEQYCDIYDQAIVAFLQMARAQFFWDVNKRTGRFMMNVFLRSCLDQRIVRNFL
ncbi:filamentation induced by cAMP protein Fic [Catenovulum agarivorans DS-2]|uniref:Filamentation induced by cAMP protein Fic n=1 Tax=Catenovulum agarivorans DS-2 TaxID=1328313 RepID=W7QBC6_9ALTE|nr:Fic family protein [Catenovulum agarivorans]EWH10089.1 filamentation induced by cAMP protein Fic [Catenovulum agarivorans DS-2]